MAETITNDALKTALEQGARAAAAIDMPNGGKAVLVPTGYQVHEFESVAEPTRVRPPPDRIEQSVILHDADGFVAYVNTFKSAHTRLFAEPGFLSETKQARIIALLDYHAPGSKGDLCTHVAAFTLRYSEQWKRWHAACREALTQEAFADFVEENMADIREPSAASLLDVINNFKAVRKVAYSSVKARVSGSFTIGHEDATEMQGQVTLPEKFKLGIPVFFRGTLFGVGVWLRYRVGGQGGVKFQLQLDRPDVIEDEAFSHIVARVGSAEGEFGGVGIPVLLGRAV